jgi:hypothetical protein
MRTTLDHPIRFAIATRKSAPSENPGGKSGSSDTSRKQMDGPDKTHLSSSSSVLKSRGSSPRLTAVSHACAQDSVVYQH